MRDCTTVAGTDVLQWRRQQLARGGTAADLDWLLDLAAGLRWASLQRLLLDPTRTVALEQSLEVLSQLWGRQEGTGCRCVIALCMDQLA